VATPVHWAEKAYPAPSMGGPPRVGAASVLAGSLSVVTDDHAPKPGTPLRARLTAGHEEGAIGIAVYPGDRKPS